VVFRNASSQLPVRTALTSACSMSHPSFKLSPNLASLRGSEALRLQAPITNTFQFTRAKHLYKLEILTWIDKKMLTNTHVTLEAFLHDAK
jgi:hypothetical protein